VGCGSVPLAMFRHSHFRHHIPRVGFDVGHEVGEGADDGDEDEVLDAGVSEVAEAAGAFVGAAHGDVAVDDLVEGLVVAAR